MEKSDMQFNEIKKTNPFKVPEGYFENFVVDMMAQLPERPVEKPKVISLWEKVKPVIYMAAMFAGIWLMINVFARESSRRKNTVNNWVSESLNLKSSTDIDDFYRYYEDELTKIVYDDTLADFYEDGDGDVNDNNLGKE